MDRSSQCKYCIKSVLYLKIYWKNYGDPKTTFRVTKLMILCPITNSLKKKKTWQWILVKLEPWMFFAVCVLKVNVGKSKVMLRDGKRVDSSLQSYTELEQRYCKIWLIEEKMEKVTVLSISASSMKTWRAREVKSSLVIGALEKKWGWG